MTSQRDYELIADVLHVRQATEPEARHVVGYIAGEFADRFEADNPRFDRNRFVRACGFPELQVGRRLIGKDMNGVWWVADEEGEYGFSTRTAARGWVAATDDIGLPTVAADTYRRGTPSE